MKIKSVHLKNIRSYLDEKIEFPEGSTLLSGDIGSGKSTILQALEFALFGIRKDLSGSDLLRHGKNHGSVSVSFEMDGRGIIVERSLKRAKSISQEDCRLVVDNQPYELTPVELKSKVLDMIGYSQELLKKNRPLFRFTVYTPQEQMKQILTDEEDRLNILRNIFGIDKYGTIRSNSRLFMTELRRMRAGLEGEIKSADADAIRLEEIRKDRITIQDRLSSEKIKLADAADKTENKKKDLDLLKKEFSDVNAARHELGRKETELSAKKKRSGQIEEEIKEIEEKAGNYINIISGMPSHKPLEQMLKELSDHEMAKERLISKKAVLFDSSKKLQRIYSEGICEVCGQKVHNQKEFLQHIEEMKLNIGKMDEETERISSYIAGLKNSISSAEKAEQYEHLIGDMDKRKSRLLAEKTGTGSDITSINRDIEFLKPRTENYESLQDRITKLEEEFYALQKNKSEAERIVARYEQQLADAESRIMEITNKIREAEKTKEKINRIVQLLSWFEPFIGLMETIEKHVMLAIQKEFNEYFQKWFGVLMGEQLAVKIDERFTPVIEQNGYITEYQNLSGGEKTSVALAYRLALNRVINDMIDTIKTKDVMILDEPTDGFSTDQLDRIRDVINELKLKQVIVVSHEPKIDTYVDNVIRIYKENHVSRVAY